MGHGRTIEAGPELLQALRSLAPCPVGGAVITPAFSFPPLVQHIVHAVGPRFGVDEPADELLASAYRASLALASQVGAESIAFPSLSTGAFQFPRLEAASMSVRTLRPTPTHIRRRVLIALDVKTARFWERALTRGDKPGGSPFPSLSRAARSPGHAAYAHKPVDVGGSGYLRQVSTRRPIRAIRVCSRDSSPVGRSFTGPVTQGLSTVSLDA